MSESNRKPVADENPCCSPGTDPARCCPTPAAEETTCCPPPADEPICCGPAVEPAPEPCRCPSVPAPEPSPCCAPREASVAEPGGGGVLGEVGRHWVTGIVQTAAGSVPQVSTDLQFADRLGSWKARWGIGRMHYRIDPGLYAVGNPSPDSPVFVTANYKMSFDRLRPQLVGRDGWILVLDTRGINVWCAAGKGSFGTTEIVNRIGVVQLPRIVHHRELIVPQLGAPGVNSHEVFRKTGFRVRFGPVRSSDLPAYLDAGMEASPEMRRVHFPLGDRVVLIPVELVHAAKFALLAAALFFFISGFGEGDFSFERALQLGLVQGLILVGAALGSVVLTAILLPWLPGRAFSMKGVWVGLILACGALGLWRVLPSAFDHALVLAGWALLIPAVASFIAMNFTGVSTYTSLSGVRREMRIALPLQVAFVSIGMGLWIAGHLI